LHVKFPVDQYTIREAINLDGWKYESFIQQIEIDILLDCHMDLKAKGNQKTRIVFAK
jgi:hypothetical protein